MKTIYGYPFTVADYTSFEAPVSAKPLHVGLDPNGTPCMWCEVDTRDPMAHHKIMVFGTGHPVPSNVMHFGSFVDGSFVWHIYLPL